MALSWNDMQARAIEFSGRWKDAASEEAQAQSFTTDFLKVFGVNDPLKVGAFEHKVPLDDGRNGYIDFLWPKKIAIEIKSRGKDIKKAYAQLKDYVVHLPEAELPELLMVCDFEDMVLFERLSGKRHAFKTADFRKHIRRFATIAGYESSRDHGDQLEVNVRAAERMARLHDELKANGYEGHELEVYLVRLLFCLFADDTGIFPADSFLEYVENSKADGSDLSQRLALLFEILNMPDEKRMKRKRMSPTLMLFRYINGGLFREMLPHADFDAKMRKILLECCRFDWSKISPAIFGSIFQGVMDRNKRRELGAHYTSEENILKLINPLFMDDLWAEFEKAKTSPAQLDRLHDKIARLVFLDPACGCGNFLIITYRELRRLELDILKFKIATSQLALNLETLLKVKVSQFYGIEHEEFPCQIAQVGMWLMDHQMNMEASDCFGGYYTKLPLKDGATIFNGNALEMDWGDIAPGLSYLLGNPPFAGRRYRTSEQQNDIKKLFTYKDIDYVCCWFKKAAHIMEKYPHIKSAFVATNSITQGEQVAALWKNLIDNDIHINFAYRNFKWNNEAKGKAAVYCVIIGFCKGNSCNKYIFENDGKFKVNNINGYLLAGPDIFLQVRSRPLCDVPRMKNGNVPLDGDALKIEAEDYHKFSDLPFVKRLIGGRELIYNEKRYVLWLVGVDPKIIKNNKLAYARVKKCKENRLAMNDQATRKLADSPATFRDTNNPKQYIALPMVSSDNRLYLPLAYFDENYIPTNQVQTIPDATLYHFGILNSSVHNNWMRAVCGRLGTGYRYSKDIVYNNFPWPDATEDQKKKIEKLAQAILDARAEYPDSNLAALYDPLSMPDNLLKAHKELDKAVLKLYGFGSRLSEVEIVGKLFEKYRRLALCQL